MNEDKTVKIKLTLEVTKEQYKKLQSIYEVKLKSELHERIDGALNNWILEMLLDQ